MIPAPEQPLDSWLDSLGLGELAPLFREHQITADMLADLTNDDLKDCGVTALGHRKTLLAAIAKGNLPVADAGPPAIGNPPPVPEIQAPVVLAVAEPILPVAESPHPPQPEFRAAPIQSQAGGTSPTAAAGQRLKPKASASSTSRSRPLVADRPATADSSGVDFAHDLQQRQDAQYAALQRQQRLSAISSAAIAILSLVLMMIILAIFVLPAVLKETPQVVVYESPTASTETQEVKKTNTSIQNKPSSPASSVARVIAATTSSPTAVPVPDLATTSPSLDFGDAEDFGDGWGNGSGSGSGAGGGTSFFGMKKATRAIVYVFDISGSMIMKPKSTKTYEVLETEIVNSIGMLGNDAKFGLVGFSKEADSYKSNLVSASAFERRDASQWLKRMSPVPAAKSKFDFKNFRNGRHSGTRADLGIQMAMKMKPDTIIFVSDGEPTDDKGKSSKSHEQSIIKMVDALQKSQERPVQINCIAYMSSGGLNFMRELAKRNQGEFREIRPKDIK